MNIKGVAFLAREAFLKKQLGEQTWNGFIAEWRTAHPSFPTSVFPVSKLPSDEFLALNDELIRRHFRNDVKSTLWSFGEQSGHYALGQGQLKGLFAPGEYRKFLQFTPQIWKSYFDGGELTVSESANGIDIRIVNVPKHVYFEYSVMGFAFGGLEVLGHPSPTPQRLKGISAGDAEIHYRFPIAV